MQNEELIIVSSILAYEKLLDEVVGKLKPEFMEDEECINLYNEYLRLYDVGEYPSVPKLAQNGFNFKRLIELQNSISLPNKQLVNHSIELIIHNYKIKKLKELGERIQEKEINPEEDIDTLITKLETIKNINFETNYKNLSEISDEYKISFENAYKNNFDGIKTGFADLDRKIHGVCDSELIILGARPGMGKTTIAINIAEYMANYKNVLFFSLEMARNELYQRLLSKNSSIELDNLTENISEKDYNKAMNEMNRINKNKLFIDDKADTSIDDIFHICRRLKRKNKLDVLFIDNINILNSTKRYNSLNERLGDLSRRLKVLAKELQIPVIVLCQLSRGVESRDVKRPIMSDLRDSGSIEQDANMVWLLYRKEYYARQKLDKKRDDYDEQLSQYNDIKHDTELIIGKNRRGQTGTINLFFNGAMSYFGNIGR